MDQSTFDKLTISLSFMIQLLRSQRCTQNRNTWYFPTPSPLFWPPCLCVPASALSSVCLTPLDDGQDSRREIGLRFKRTFWSERKKKRKIVFMSGKDGWTNGFDICLVLTLSTFISLGSIRVDVWKGSGKLDTLGKQVFALCYLATIQYVNCSTLAERFKQF